LPTETSEPVGSLEVALAHTERLLAASPALAAQQAQEILKVVPGQRDARRLLARALWSGGDQARAVEILRRGLASDRRDPEQQLSSLDFKP
jgi:predicted Zn-dependent protease